MEEESSREFRGHHWGPEDEDDDEDEDDWGGARIPPGRVISVCKGLHYIGCVAEETVKRLTIGLRVKTITGDSPYESNSRLFNCVGSNVPGNRL
jgi:hypothetical protein